VTITPRVIYQDVDMDGVNREDVWNILANPYTTTEPRVTMKEREQYRQFEERFDEEFTLADLTAEFDLGPAVLTSVSSYTNRNLLMLRDASQLTGSVTFDILGDVPQVRLDSALNDETLVEVFTQELRLTSDTDSRFQWVVGGFYSDIDRDYGQTLDTPGYDALLGLPGAAVGAPPDTPFYSRIPYDFKQMAFFAEGSWDITDRFNATVGLRYYDFEEERNLYFGGAFADSDGLPDEPTNGPGKTDDDGVLPRVLLAYNVSDDVQLNAQAAQGFRLGGINDPLNIPLCTGDDIPTYGATRRSTARRSGTTSSGQRSALRRAAATSTSPRFTPTLATCRCPRWPGPVRRASRLTFRFAFHRRRDGADGGADPIASTSGSMRLTRSRKSIRP
jgi:iron complex outermembrane receptor protein